MPKSKDRKQRTVLVIDDSIDDRRVITRHLRHDRSVDYNIVEADNGTDGIRLASETHPDVIILDYHLGDSKGTDVLVAIRDRSNADIPVLLLTGSLLADKENVNPIELGADDFLNKDEISGAHLRRAVSNAIAKARMRAELQAALNELQERVEFERRLIAVVGHDLRTPLNSIGLATELLSEESLPDQASHLVKRLRRTTDNMATLVEQLLNVTRIRNSEGYPVDRVETDLKVFIETKLQPLADDYPEHNLTIASDVSGSALIDVTALGQIAANLVNNAARYGSSAEITLTAQSTETEVTIEVSNQGDEIPERLQKNLFKAFVRANPGGKGLGLGLFIVQAAASAHSGAVAIYSKNGETRFTVTVPRSGPASEG